MNSKLILLTITWLYITSINLSAQNVISLKDLLRSAIEKSYDLESSHAEIQKDVIDRSSLNYKYLPTISLTALGGYSKESIKMVFPEYTPLPNLLPNFKLFSYPISMVGSSPKIGGAIDFKWLIFSGGKIPYLKKSLDNKIKAKQLMHTKEEEDLIIEITDLYYKIALINQSQIVLNQSKTRLEAERERVTKAIKVGLAIPIDLQKIQVATIKLNSKYIEYKNSKLLLFKRLSQLTNYKDDELKNIKVKLTPSNVITTNNNYDISNRPEIQALDASIQAYTYYLKSTKTWFIPKIQLISQINYAKSFNSKLSGLIDNISFTSKNITIGPNVLVGAGLKWDIFDGLNGNIDAKKASIDIELAKNKRKKAQELLEINIYKTKGQYELLTSQVQLKNEELRLTKEILDVEINKYKYGLNSINDRLEAEVNIQQAELEYLKVVYDQRLAAINFLKSTQRLTIDNVNL